LIVSHQDRTGHADARESRPHRRVTFRDIAKLSGFSVATVSRSLRDSPLIAAETRRKVKRAALQLRYSPDPGLASLAAYRWERFPNRHTQTISLVALDESLERQSRSPQRMELIDSITREGNRHGYEIAYCPAGISHRDQQRNSAIMWNRGIRGLILLPGLPNAESIAFDWKHFAVVRILSPPTELRVPSVNSNTHQGMHLLAGELVRRRYRRPGLIIPLESELGSYGDWSIHVASLNAFSSRLHPVASLVYSSEPGTVAHRRELKHWLTTARPDVVLCVSDPKYLAEIRHLGYDVPGNLGVVCLGLQPNAPNKDSVSGFLTPRKELGELAVIHLHSLLLANRLGLLDRNYEVAVPYRWKDGTTLRPLK